MSTTDRGDEIVALLGELRDLQKQTLANQERSIAAQTLAISRQRTHLRLVVVVFALLLPLMGVLGWLLFRFAAPYL